MANRKENEYNLKFDNQKLQRLRISRNLTQKEFACELNFGISTVIKWENGIAKPRLFDMYRIAKFFGKSIEDFIIEKGDM